MNRDQLELVLRREGLTQPQTAAVLTAADAYATTQVAAAIDALSYQPPPVHLLDLTRPGTMNACGKPGVNTTQRGDVTCGTCLVVQ